MNKVLLETINLKKTYDHKNGPINLFDNVNIKIKTGDLIALKNVTDIDDLMVINKSGITIRIGVDSLRVMGRATQGVKLIRLRDEDSIASVAKVSKFEDEDTGQEDEDLIEANADEAINSNVDNSTEEISVENKKTIDHENVESDSSDLENNNDNSFDDNKDDDAPNLFSDI